MTIPTTNLRAAFTGPNPDETRVPPTSPKTAPADPPGPEGMVTIPKDDAFHILQTARRRAVLRYFLEHTDQTRFRMRDLAEDVAAWEHDKPIRQLRSDERQRVYIALYQSHLPKLDDYGIINYNQSRGIVEPTPLVHAFSPYLEEGLHAETDNIAIEHSDKDRESGITDVVTTFFTR